MAITWECKITNAKPDEFRADIAFKRVDDIALAEENYSFSGTIIETTSQRLALLDLVWQKHLETINKQSAINNFITNLEELAKTNLEGRES